MTLSLSYDHRIVDGALASKFLTEIKKNMENFEKSLDYRRKRRRENIASIGDDFVFKL
jgi:hypothetical protein